MSEDARPFLAKRKTNVINAELYMEKFLEKSKSWIRE